MVMKPKIVDIKCKSQVVENKHDEGFTSKEEPWAYLIEPMDWRKDFHLQRNESWIKTLEIQVSRKKLTKW